MTFTWEEIINRARVYVDDHHREEDGWLTPAQWMTLAQVEYAQLYRRWIRNSLIAPLPTDRSLLVTGVETALEGVLAIIGVAEVTGSGSSAQYRVLQACQPDYGRMPFRSGIEGTAVGWEAYGTGDTITVRVYPPDTTRDYIIRYIETPALETDITEDVDLPYGADERLVLGIARRSHLVDSITSSLLNGLITDADAELNLLASMRGARFHLAPARSTPRNFMPNNPNLWRWF